MSLFPAYATAKTEEPTQQLPSGLDWLKNVSYTADIDRSAQLFSSFIDEHERTVENNELLEQPQDLKGPSKTKFNYKSKRLKKLDKKKKKAAKLLEEKRITEAGPPKKVFIDQFDQFSSKQTFRIDKSSDRANYACGSLAPVHIAKYYREKNYAKIFGYSDGKYDKKDRVKRYFNHRNENNEPNTILDLSTPKVSWEEHNQNTPCYLTLEMTLSKMDEEMHDTSDTKNETVTINQRLREDPHNVDLWLEFVKFQSDSVDAKNFMNRETSGKQSEKLAESVVLDRKLAILDKAIEKNSKAVELFVCKLKLCKDIWETDKLASEWKKLLFLHPNNTSLWQQYLLFFQTKFSTFTVSKFVKLNEKCFSALKKILEGTFQSHRTLPHMEEQIISIFCNYCNVLCQSGYQEKAVANFQALIEFNFFAPPQFSTTKAVLEDKLAFFEPFWDSGVPRFGENNSPGWSNVMKNKQFDVVYDTSKDDDEENKAIRLSELKWRNWLRLERLRCRNNWFPWQPRDENDSCEDSERMVLLDDVLPTLFNIKEVGNRFLLIVQFLKFLGVSDICVNVDSVCGTLQRSFNGYLADIDDVLKEGRYFNWKFYTLPRISDCIPMEHSVLRSEKLTVIINNVFESARTLFQDQPKYHKLMTLFWIRWKVSQIKCKELNVRKMYVKEVKSFIKNFLKEDENRYNYDLWIEYCIFEMKCGNVGETKKVFELLINTHRSWDLLSDDERSSLSNIYCQYSVLLLAEEEHLKDSSNNRLLQLVSSFAQRGSSASKTSLTPSAILKARIKFKNLIEEQITAENGINEVVDQWDFHYSIVSLVTCYSIFEYATAGLNAAEQVLTNALQLLELNVKPWSKEVEDWKTPVQIRRYVILEFLYTHWIRLHVVYSNTQPASPLELIRKVLERALHMFPSNVYYNNLLLDIESKSHLGMKLRKYYNSRLKGSCSSDIESAVFSIIGELERMRNIIISQEAVGPNMSYEIGITHRLRSLFENILKHSQLCHCILIWRLYLKFEAMQGYLKNCKNVFYRALQHCPWAKIIYMDAVELFPEDLQELHDLMTEKEIRIMAPLEEVALLLELEGKINKPELNSEDASKETSAVSNS